MPAGASTAPAWPARLGAPLFAAVVWSVLLLVVGSAVWSANKGFEFSDESYYLLSYRFPYAAPPAVTQFQYIVDAMTLHHELSVAGYRVLEVVVLLVGSVVLMLAFLAFLRGRLPRQREALPSTSSLCAFAAIAGLLGLAWLARGISYLTLTTVLTELAVGAVLVAAASPPSPSPRPAPSQVMLVVGAGVALTLLLFTKFPTAIVVGVLLVAFLVATGGWRRGALLVAVLGGGAAMALAALSVDLVGGPFSIDGLRRGADITAQGTHNVRDLLSHDLHLAANTSVLSVRSVLLGLTFAAPVVARLVAPRFRVVLGWALALPGPVAVVLALRSPWLQDVFRSHRVVYMAVGGIVGGLVLVGLASWVLRRRDPSVTGATTGSWPSRRPDGVLLAAVVVLLLALPLATSVGSNTDVFLLSINAAAPFACLIVLAWTVRAPFLETGARQTVLSYLPLVFTTVMFAVILVNGILIRPYKLTTSIAGQTQAVRGLPGLSGVDVDPKTAAMLHDLQARVTSVSTFRPGDLLIVDEGLEGVAYALGGRLPGSQWFDNTGSGCATLERVPAELAQTDLVVRVAAGSPAFDACLQRVLPGFPADFESRATVPGPGDEQLEILVRR